MIKTKLKEDLIADIEATFNCMRRFRMKLNLEKCVFGVASRKLLDYIMTHDGIEANPEKVETILKMSVPTCVKDIHKLSGCMPALSRFISRLGKHGMPFYKLLKKVDKFQWTPEAQEAFDSLKKFLTTPPVLKSPHRATADHPAEDLLLYISCMTHVVNSALVVERQEEGHVQPTQHLVYFISEVLSHGSTDVDE